MKRIVLASKSIPFGSECPFQESTDTSYYDNFLNDQDLEYMRKNKNRDGKIVMMSPSEYYEECATNIFEKTSVDRLKAQRNANSELIREYEDAMKSGDKFPLCYLNYADSGQEGLHRMMAAGNLYGWDTKFPVLVINVVDPKREELNNIWRWWVDAVGDAEEYTYDADTWEEDLVKEVEFNLESTLEKHYDVVIVRRRSKEECEKYDSDYAIEIALAEFEDMMHPSTVFTPKLRDSQTDKESSHKIDLDELDLDDIDWDELLTL